MKSFDVHCHFDKFEDPEKAIEDAKKHVQGVINPGTNHSTNTKVLEFSEKYKGFVFAALSIHPIEVAKLSSNEIEKELKFIEKNKDKIVAVGETGLDNFWIKKVLKGDYEREKEKQEILFRKLIRLAKVINKPIIVHSRWSTNKVLNILKEEKAKNVVLHSFPGTADEIEEGLKLGYYFSLNPNSALLAEKVPLDKILMETDSPYMKYKGEPNSPASVEYIIEMLVRVKNVIKDEIIEQTNKNVKKVFGL